MRIKKSFLNATSSTFIYIIRAVLLFVVRIVFVKTLGKIYLGVDSLFTNILTVLSIADLGISTAVNYCLYKPLSDKNYKRVSTIMTFYKRVYNIFGVVVLVIGLLIIPFLKFIIREPIDNLYLIYLIYLFTTVITYFISYKDALLNADQNYYKSSIIVGSTYILMYFLRIMFLYLLPNFILFALIQLVMIIIQRILVNIYITKTYKHINFNSKEKLSKDEQKEIFYNIESLFVNKVGGYLVNGTDNIIISSLTNLGVGVVAVYTNYYSITGMLDTILTKAISSITASFGDLAVNEDTSVQENVLNIIQFLSFFIFGLLSIGFMFLLSLLIKICFGIDFELGYYTVLIISLNFYFTGVIRPLDMVKEATGFYKQDRYANLIQAVINIVLSIVLGKIFGLFGVVLATLLSTILVPLWNRPYITYKYIFNKKPFKFLLKQFVYLLSICFTYVVIYFVVRNITLSNNIVLFIVKAILITALYFVIISILYGKTKEYKFFIDKVLGVLKINNQKKNN